MTVKDIDPGFKRITKSISKLAGMDIQVGYTDPDLAVRAAATEFGTATQPARPFMRRAFDQRRTQPGFDQKIGKMIDGEGPEKTAKEMGEVIKVAIQTQIDTAASWAAPLDESTIAQKGFDVPLVDSGAMREGVEVTVK